LKSTPQIGFNEGDLDDFRTKMLKILDFEYFKKKIKNSIKLQKMDLKGEVSQVTSSHPSQWHKLQ
jgi:hypothetical protein